jgi:hypothetical protein
MNRVLIFTRLTFTYENAQKNTPESHVIYLGFKEIYWIFKTSCTIYVVFSKIWRLFDSFIFSDAFAKLRKRLLASSCLFVCQFVHLCVTIIYRRWRMNEIWVWSACGIIKKVKKNKLFGEKLVPGQLYHKTHTDWSGAKPEPQSWQPSRKRLSVDLQLHTLPNLNNHITEGRPSRILRKPGCSVYIKWNPTPSTLKRDRPLARPPTGYFIAQKYFSAII